MEEKQLVAAHPTIPGNGGVKMTRQRRAILEMLMSTETHPTADEVYMAVRKQLPNVSLGTIYRNLEMLCQNGLVRKLDMAGAQRRYDGDMSGHYHVRCIYCDRIGDMRIASMTFAESIKYAPKNFVIVGHNLKFLGVCSECRARGLQDHVISEDDK